MMLKNSLIFAISLLLVLFAVSCTKEEIPEIQETQEMASEKNQDFDINFENGMLSFGTMEDFTATSKSENHAQITEKFDFVCLEEAVLNIEKKEKNPYYQYDASIKQYKVFYPHMDIAKLLNKDGAVLIEGVIVVFTPEKVYSIKDGDYTKVTEITNGKTEFASDNVFESILKVDNISTQTDNLKGIEGSCSYNNPANCEFAYQYVMITQMYSYQYAVSLKPPCGGKKGGCTRWTYKLVNRTYYYEFIDANSSSLKPVDGLWYTWNPSMEGSFTRTGSYGPAFGNFNIQGGWVACNSNTGYCPYYYTTLIDQDQMFLAWPQIPQYDVFGSVDLFGAVSVPNCADLVFPCDFGF